MATASTGWGSTCTAEIVEDSSTYVKIKVTSYWQNKSWDYNINRVSSWVYCNGSEVQVLNSGSVNSTGVGTSGKLALGSYTFTVNKTTSAQHISCYAKITSSSSYVSGTKTSDTVAVGVSQIISYTVSYNLNGGSGTFANQIKWHGTNLTLYSTTPTKAGHTFLGWGTSASDTTVDYSSGATYSANAGIILYAIWKANTYTVSYNLNGGSGTFANQTKTYGKTLTLHTAIPTRTYYTFLGWATYQTATTATYSAGGSYTSNSSVTLYAVWELNYIAPRINNLSIWRCDADGTFNEEGTYAKISFDWAVDRTGGVYAVYYKKLDETDYIGGTQVTLSGTSGSEEAVVSGTFDTEYAYNIKLNVADSYGYSSSYITLNSLFLAIDCTEDGKSMSFGTPVPEEVGLLRFAYDRVDISPISSLTYKNGKFFGGNLIWSGSSTMTEGSYITLTNPMSSLKNGLMLIFGRDSDYNLTPCFVPKDLVAQVGRTTYSWNFSTALFEYIGTKSLYISDTKIEGHSSNASSGTANGVTYSNGQFFLRYVYEV